jgi:hypothetical protein
MKVSLKGWAKVKEAKDHTVLKNKQGHELKISHKALSKPMQDELSKIPHMDNGGAVMDNVPDNKGPLDAKKGAEISKGFNSATARGSQSASSSGTQSYDDGGYIQKAGEVKNSYQKATHSQPQSNDNTLPTHLDDTTPVNTAQAAKDASAKVNEDYKASHGGQDSPYYHPMADGGKVRKNYDAGGDVDASKPVSININAAPQGSNGQMPPVPAQMQQQNQPNAIPEQPEPPTPQEQTENDAQVAAKAPPAGNSQATPQTAAPDQSMPQQAAQPVPDPNAGFNMGNQAADIGQKAETALAGQQADTLQKQNEAVARFGSNTNQNLNSIMQESNNIAEDIKNTKIDPNHFLGNKDTWSKVQMGIGLILGGIGGGITGQANPALQFLNKQIDNDIEAQKANLGKKQSLLASNMQLYKDYQAAAGATKAQMADLFTKQLEQQALKQGGPLAQQRALNTKQQLIQQYYPIAMQSAMRQAMMQESHSGGDMSHLLPMLRINNPEMAKEIESRSVPGIPGQAQVPLSPEDRSDLFAKQNFDHKINDYINFAQQHSGSLNPATIAIGKAKAAELQGLYRQATHGGVYKEGEAKFIDSLIDSDPAKFANELRGVIPKAQTLKQSNADSLSLLKQSKGFPTPQGQAEQPQQQSSQPQIKTVNGIKYIRGPGGKAIRVT